MLTICKSPLAVWFSTSSRHHHIAGNANTERGRPKHFAEGSPSDFPNDLFDTVDFGLKGTNFFDTYAYKELRERSRNPQATLTRLRPFLPVPYLQDLGLQPPILALPCYEQVNPSKPTPLAFVSHQIFKLPDFMLLELPKVLKQSNCGAVGLTLRQLDAANLTLLQLHQMKRTRPLVIITEGLPSSFNKQLVPLQSSDILSLKAQVSLIKWLGRRTVEAYQYQEEHSLAPVYESLWFSDSSHFQQQQGDRLSVTDPFELPQRQQLKIQR